MVSEWNGTDAWLVQVREFRGPDETATAERIISWADEHDLKHRGQGKRADTKGVIYMPIIPEIDWDPVPFHVKSKLGRAGLEGSSIGGSGRRPYGDSGRFERLLIELKAIPGMAQGKDTYPDIALAELDDQACFDAYFGVMDAIVKNVRRSYL